MDKLLDELHDVSLRPGESSCLLLERMEDTAARLALMSERQTERTIIPTFLKCLPPEYEREVQTLRGITTYDRAELKRRIGACYATLTKNRASGSHALAAGLRAREGGGKGRGG